MSTSIFTKIINQKKSAHLVYEDEYCVVILDKYPAVKGQTLVIPKIEVDYAFDLQDDIYLHLFTIAKMIAKASDKALNAKRTCLVIEGFDVPHVHIKLYPMKHTDQALGEIMPQIYEATNEELVVVATQIIAAIDEA